MILGPEGRLLNFLTRKQLDEVHDSILDVLEEVGIVSESRLISKTFADAGAEVDSDMKHVKLPRSLVEEALKKAPHKTVLKGRDPKRDILLEDGRVYFGLGGTPIPYILDYRTGEFRRPNKEDVVEATRLGDALESITFMMSIAGAFDTPREVEYLYELEAIMDNTGKPIIHPAPGAEYAKKILEMAAIVAGGWDELHKRPIVCLYSEAASPLILPIFNENIIEFAEMRLPIVFGPCPMAGATAPASVVGSVLIGSAETLAAITLAELVGPGTPVIFGPHPGVMDMRTSRFQYAATELAMGWSVVGQLADYYEIPSFGQGGCADSKIPDAQAGIEAMTMGLLNAMAGVNLIHNVGTISMGSVGSMEMAVICDEMIGMIHRILRGVEVDSNTLALDVIRQVGPGGHYLSQKHTLEFYQKEVYIPKLFDKGSEQAWIDSGRKSIRQKARERVREILTEHKPETLSKDVKQKLAEVIKQAEARFTTKK